jgi:hypothetical protein
MLTIDADMKITVLLTVAIAVLVWGITELTRETKRVEVAVVKADLSAAEISALMREANDILKKAAEGGPGALD